jgi:hypothetical protein
MKQRRRPRAQPAPLSGCTFSLKQLQHVGRLKKEAAFVTKRRMQKRTSIDAGAALSALMAQQKGMVHPSSAAAATAAVAVAAAAVAAGSKQASHKNPRHEQNQEDFRMYARQLPAPSLRQLRSHCTRH